jgi:flagellar biosynthesis anti-sigma factor FlgM
MQKRRKKKPGKSSPAAKHNRKSPPGLGPLRSPLASRAHLVRNNKLIDQVRQIIAATPEVRPEKVAPLLEAVAAGTYEIDARKVANRLIAELLLKR